MTEATYSVRDFSAALIAFQARRLVLVQSVGQQRLELRDATVYCEALNTSASAREERDEAAAELTRLLDRLEETDIAIASLQNTIQQLKGTP